MRRLNPTRRHRRGTYSMSVSILLPALIGMAGMGVDYGAVAVAEIQVQAAADSAAMAATTSLDDYATARERAEAYGSLIRANSLQPTVTSFELGLWDADAETFRANRTSANAARVVTEATVPMYFARLFGVEEVTVRGVAGAGIGLPGRAPDTVLVLDVTQSMSQWEIQAEREATETLLSCMKERSSEDSRASIVLFGGVDYVQVDMKEFGGDYDDLVRAAGSIQGCGPRTTPCSNTNPASGYEAALKVLEDAETPADVGQAIILMSDGEPVPYPAICSNGYLRKYDQGDYLFPLRERCAEVGGWRGVDYRALDGWAQTAKELAEERQVDTYTVFYGRSWAGSNFLSQRIRAGKGTHHDALTSDMISEAFTDICLESTVGDAALLF